MIFRIRSPKGICMETRLYFNIYKDPIKSVQYDGEIAESLLLDI